MGKFPLYAWTNLENLKRYILPPLLDTFEKKTTQNVVYNGMLCAAQEWRNASDKEKK